jgi:DNA-binding MarR family transcriptional regulator
LRGGAFGEEVRTLQTELVKELVDACFLAKKITELTPPLPGKMVPRHNNVIDAIHELSQTQPRVFVSDVARRLGTTPPSITKLVGQLEDMGYVRKLPDPNDRRFVAPQLTDKGEDHFERYVRSYHEELAQALRDLDEDRCRTTVQTIRALYEKMQACVGETRRR